MNLPPVTDQDDDDPDCRFCISPATHYNENLRICTDCMHEVANACDTPKEHAEYLADWKPIADFKPVTGENGDTP